MTLCLLVMTGSSTSWGASMRMKACLHGWGAPAAQQMLQPVSGRQPPVSCHAAAPAPAACPRPGCHASACPIAVCLSSLVSCSLLFVSCMSLSTSSEQQCRYGGKPFSSTACVAASGTGLARQSQIQRYRDAEQTLYLGLLQGAGRVDNRVTSTCDMRASIHL